MWRKSLITGTVLVLSMVVLTASAWATCEQQDLVGTWNAKVWTTDDCLWDQCWDRCELTIGSDGTIQQDSTLFYWLGGSWTITGGQLTMDSGCVIGGDIYTSGGTLHIEHGGIIGDELVLRAVRE